MATTRDTVIGVFHSHAAAQAAVRRLKDAGFQDDHIGLVAHDPESRYAEPEREAKGSHAGSGAAAGAGVGAGVGALWGLGIVAGMLPAIGPVIAGGALASVLASAAGAAAAGGLAGALVGMGIPEEEAEYYEREFHQGRTIVTVREATRFAEAQRIMRDAGAYDFETQESVTGADTRTDTPHPASAGAPGRPHVVYGDEATTGARSVPAGDVRTRR